MKNKPEPDSDLILYLTEDGRTRLQVRLEGETVWLSLNQMADLFQRDKSVISRHIKNVFEEGELSAEATVAKYATVQTEGGKQVTREIEFYNLDVIISVGYRVKSKRGTQFRIWATQRLREYIVKGFTMDDERLKNPPGKGHIDYFDELLERIRDIRSSERRVYLRVREILALAADYEPTEPETQVFFQTIQNNLHFIHHLAPQGMAGFVLANGSMSSNQSGEGDIRRALIEADLVDCMVALPGQLFYSTQIPVCLWFIPRDKSGAKPSTRPVGHPSPSGRRDGDDGQRALRDRRGETLFIDARKLGTLIDRVHRELTDADLEKITSTYHLWRGDPHPTSGHPLPVGKGRGEGNPAKRAKYEDVPGFCKSATTQEIASHGWVLTPGRYVGAEEVEDDGDPFEEKMPRRVAELHAQFAESAKLEAAIRANLKSLNFTP